ncbi:MAG TPA: class I SAM-dependent methyltransferase [Candidatus Acidoferrum sp.]|nr:class I SAM-dependent methyltransferase [Candidatus Acidoferrum sp.]
MRQADEPNAQPGASYYDANYGNFQTELYAEIRREAFGEDIGQNSWLTAKEQDLFLGWLNLSPGNLLLDVACGSGGPALRIVAKTKCSLVGIDLHDQAISTANSLAAQSNLKDRVEFRVVDASEALPFPNAHFDAIICVDAINHILNRPSVMAQWARLLKPGGRLLFTDPITVTGPLTTDEIAVRGSAGSMLFVPQDYDKEMIALSGLRLVECRDGTANVAEVATKRCAARKKRSAAVRQVEGDRAYEAQQTFLAMAARLAAEGRLSRIAYVSERIR